MKPVGFLEISALLESHWTGIPAVTAAIAEKALADPSVDWHFFYGALTVPNDFVGQLLIARDGSLARDYITRHVWDRHDIDYATAANAKAIFTTMKTARGLFKHEGLLVYDLSPLLTPQFHTQDNVNHFANRFRADVETSDHFFCISAATRDDMVAYFQIPPGDCSIVPMGVSIDLCDVTLSQELARDCAIEPYVVVLGTLEPRKNGRMVLQYLIRNPGFANRFRVVFIGREGWLDERAQLLEEIETAGVSPDRIVFTGFVSETEKVALLQNCSFCIYASFFEGYGLPILEAAVLGKMVVCSGSSSMPEVAPEKSFFFDPLSTDEFADAMARAEKATAGMRGSSSLSEVTTLLETHNWDRCYKPIAVWVKEL